MEGHLSVTGIGPYYVCTIVAVSLTLMLLGHHSLLPFLGYGALDVPMKAIGAVLILAGIWTWYSAVVRSGVSEAIEGNRLVTDGVYAWVRNPIYTAFTFIMWGVLLMTGNALFLLTVPAYWLLMTVMLRCTEEKWLLELYGGEYEEYCGRVNRCMPFPPRR